MLNSAGGQLYQSPFLLSNHYYTLTAPVRVSHLWELLVIDCRFIWQNSLFNSNSKKGAVVHFKLMVIDGLGDVKSWCECLPSKITKGAANCICLTLFHIISMMKQNISQPYCGLNEYNQFCYL